MGLGFDLTGNQRTAPDAPVGPNPYDCAESGGGTDLQAPRDAHPGAESGGEDYSGERQGRQIFSWPITNRLRPTQAPLNSSSKLHVKDS
jgi:hypothetical protein